MRLFLTGFMGVGKTTVGRHLGESLGRPFLDLDDLIESSEGASIDQIFRERGETAFRRLELALLLAGDFPEDAVVATGGGTLVDPPAMDRARELGRVVWLNLPFDTIASRIDGDRGGQDRPLFTDLDRAAALFRSRQSAYARADVRIDVSESESPAEVSVRVVDWMRGLACGT